MLLRFCYTLVIVILSLPFISCWNNEFLIPGFKNNKLFAKFLLPVNQVKNESTKCPCFRKDFLCADTSLKIINGTFLGNNSRNFYGDSIGAHLNVLWKTSIGKGQTICVGDKIETWMGAGWTGQPLMAEEKGIPFIVQGCYDHKLKKINAVTGEITWEYSFDDIIKGTGTLYYDKEKKELIIMQGSRIGFGLKSWQKEIFSYRAVSYNTGNEYWRMNVKHGPSYSRDVDASSIVLKDTAYIGLENGHFLAFDPRQQNAEMVRDSFRPKIIQQLDLFDLSDKKLHGGELVTESSPCKLRDHLYITSGSGHVYGYNLITKTIDWDFYVGSDLDGSAVVTQDSCLIITIEKQFIKGRGGAMKIDPSKSPGECVQWYFPTGNKDFSDWKGGIIGSAAVSNNCHNKEIPQLCAFMAIDGFLYVVDQGSIEKDALVYGPDSISKFPKPKILFREKIGASISTPLIIGNRIVATGYSGIKIIEFDRQLNFKEIASCKGFFEATPFAYKGKIYVASRNGFLYCFGKKTNAALP